MIKKIYKKYEIIFNVIFFSIFPITAFYLMEFYEHNPFEEVRFMAGFFYGQGEMGTSCSYYRGHGFWTD